MNTRRLLQFSNLDHAIEEAERLANVPTRITGQHSHGQIIRHLALTMDVACGHEPSPTVPWLIRTVAPWLKRKALAKPVKPGFKLPASAESFFWPNSDIEVPVAMVHLRDSWRRYQSCSPLPPHPVFGKMTQDEHDKLQCMHFALHLSFVHPVIG
ncbi:hypothetical protein Pla22_30800 [Rubripirellula amarantea]|uniref:DUF1569 domain-containing protein n=1 Tax=Rubripirellula amarantea TaxID=2527999 RepID=A0A5C5WHR8_9BACT|nr:DUF1569 domain-containing protein [Rubripirellula amarantea]TWT50338.1 hypothetical protein Pla22_30800 [Rubripirellula amarantea]